MYDVDEKRERTIRLLSIAIKKAIKGRNEAALKYRKLAEKLKDELANEDSFVSNVDWNYSLEDKKYW
jgi:hypothetical protein